MDAETTMVDIEVNRMSSGGKYVKAVWPGDI